MRIVVTGASGNVGTALLRALRGRDDEIVGIARRPPADATAYGSVTWSAIDLTDAGQEQRLRDAVAGADAVVHLAWGFQPSHRLDHLEALGVGGTRRVAEAAVAAGVPHLVHMSSVGAYAARRDDRPVTEDYPTSGVPSSPYSRHKSAAEALLDGVESRHPELVLTRLRPGIIGQRSAGSALLRYAVPGWLPSAVLRHVPLLPLDRRLDVPFVHADDVAAAILRVLEVRPRGAFNLAAGRTVSARDVADVLGARLVPLPAAALRAGVAGAWKARLLQLDPGWIDLAYAVPRLDSGRAERELDWRPERTGREVLEEVIAGLTTATSDETAVLRPRSVADNLRSLPDGGPVHRRRTP